jgi:hypothetical protein
MVAAGCTYGRDFLRAVPRRGCPQSGSTPQAWERRSAEVSGIVTLLLLASTAGLDCGGAKGSWVVGVSTTSSTQALMKSPAHRDSLMTPFNQVRKHQRL